jgi:RNA polymerase sigma-70 factor (ECF subfamily)
MKGLAAKALAGAGSMIVRPGARLRLDPGRLDELGDVEIAHLCAARNKHAWDYVIRKYRALIYSIPLYAFSMREEDANDIFQDVCLTLVERIGTYKAQSRLSHWIATITRNKCIDHIRKRRPEVVPDKVLQRLEDKSPSVEARILECERKHHLGLCLDTLPAQFKETVKRRLEGLTNKQIAARAKALENTVATRIYRSVGLLIECLRRVGII